jgi:hypothetical protein
MPGEAITQEPLQKTDKLRFCIGTRSRKAIHNGHGVPWAAGETALDFVQ